MANQNHEEFVDQRLRDLKEPEGFAPSTTHARIILGTRPTAGTGRWVWKAALATMLFLLFGALPAARAVAQTGTLSPETFFRSVHETMYDVHMFFWNLFQHVPWPGN